MFSLSDKSLLMWLHNVDITVAINGHYKPQLAIKGKIFAGPFIWNSGFDFLGQ